MPHFYLKGVYMFEITGITDTDIRLTRGDTAFLSVELFDDSGKYDLKTGDKLELSAKKSINDTSYSIHITANNDAVFTFNPSDTANLAYGSYLYDIQLTLANGDIFTVIPLSHIVICEEITQ